MGGILRIPNSPKFVILRLFCLLFNAYHDWDSITIKKKCKFHRQNKCKFHRQKQVQIPSTKHVQIPLTKFHRQITRAIFIESAPLISRKYCDKTTSFLAIIFNIRHTPKVSPNFGFLSWKVEYVTFNSLFKSFIFLEINFARIGPKLIQRLIESNSNSQNESACKNNKFWHFVLLNGDFVL